MTTATKRLTAKQESFCLNYFKLRNATEAAIKAGYAPLYAAQNCDKLLKLTKIHERIGDLRSKAESAAIMDVVERKKRLTEVGRANLIDFMDSDGNVTLKGSCALAEYSVVETKMGTNRSLKLRDPIAAIQELNRMERIGQPDTVVNNNIDNRQIHITVQSELGKHLLERMKSGKLPTLVIPRGE